MGLAVLSGICVFKSGLSTPIRVSLIVVPNNLPSADRDELNFPVMHAYPSVNYSHEPNYISSLILPASLRSSQSSTLLLPAGDRWRHAEIKLPATDQNISYYWS